MANALDNSTTADTAIVALYPEIADIADLLDSLATVGRKKYVVTLEDTDHASAILTHLSDTLEVQGYKIVRRNEYIIISF